MSKSSKPFAILIPGLTVFLSSACIMILELVAGRLIARFLGSSLYTWTSVIGVVLAGITIGNYLGGRIADKYRPKKTLALLFGLASASCIIIVVLNNIVGEWVWLWKLSWPVRVFSHVAIVFLLPSTLLGMISPVVAKMALDQGLPPGRTVGDIYAFGAAGSIAGTFAAGFWLIAWWGTQRIVIAVALGMAILSVLYCMRAILVHVWAVVIIGASFLALAPIEWCQEAGAALKLRKPEDPRLIYEDESPYCYIAVRQVSEEPDVRQFMQDKLKHSEIVMDNLEELKYFYTHIYAGVTAGLDKEKLSAMVIGGGGYVFPQYLEKHYPGSRIDVIEIDPGVTEAAMAAFGLPRDTSINTFNMDARNYVDELLHERRLGKDTVEYDIIFEDAINDYSVPFQLVTKEFNDKAYEILADDGVYLVNLIDIYNSSLFMGAVVSTLEETFPYVYVATEQGSPKDQRNTYVVICAKQKLDLPAMMGKYKGQLDVWYLNSSEIQTVKARSDNFILTDDYAPVENMLAPVVLNSASEFSGLKYYSRAGDFAQKEQYDRSIETYQKAVLAYPQLSVRAYNQMGLMYAAQGKFEKAVEAFEKAVEYDSTATEKHNLAIASVHFNIGICMQRLNRPADAKAHFDTAIADFRKDIRQNPDEPELHMRLGDALASIGQLGPAAEAFREVVKLDPSNSTAHFNLARALEFQKRYDEAIAAMARAIKAMTESGNANEAARFKTYLAHLRQKKGSAN